MASGTDWQEWHRAYDNPDSPLSQRLRVVQGHVADVLRSAAPRPVRVVSCCAGDGRDLLDVLAAAPDADRVTATLLEADPAIADRARTRVGELGLAQVEVRCTDAGTTDAFGGAVPADLVLLCGVFGNVPDDDVHGTVAAAPQLCAPGAVVVWTRHRRAPDLTVRVRACFDAAGFLEDGFTAPEDGLWAVGVHRLIGVPEALRPGQRLFRFTR